MVTIRPSTGTLGFNADRGYRARRSTLRAYWAPYLLLAGLVGSILGLVALVAPSLPPQSSPLVIAAVLGPFVAAMVGQVRRLLLALAIFDIPFGIDIYLDYHQDVGALGAVGGWNIGIGTLALLGLYSLWLAGSLTGAGPRVRLVLRPAAPLLLYFVFNVLSALAASEPILSFFQIFWLLQMSLLYLYVASTVRTRQDVLFVVTIVMLGLLFESLLMIGLGVTGKAFSFGAISTRIDPAVAAQGGVTRVAGTVGSPNAAAAYLSFLLAPALSLTLSDLSPRLRVLAAMAFGLGTAALVLTFSRGGLIAFAISMLILVAFALRRGWLSPATVWVAGVMVGVIIAVFHDPLAARFFGSDNGAAYARIPLMSIAFHIIADHPVLGVGVNNFAGILPGYAGPEFSNQFIYTVHNMYLMVWAEIGLAGLVAFLWFLLTTLRRAWRCANSLGRDLSPLALGLMAGLTGQLFHMFVDVFNGWSQLESLWLMAGLLAAMSMLPAAQTSRVRHLRARPMPEMAYGRRAPVELG